MRTTTCLAAMAVSGLLCLPAAPAFADDTLGGLSIQSSREQNRKVSFSNKRSAFFYTQTHANDAPEHAYFRGFNLAGRRIFNDYAIDCGDVALAHADARHATVAPDALTWTYAAGQVETLRLFDDRDLVEVTVAGANGECTLTLSGETIRPVAGAAGHYVSQTPGHAPDHVRIAGKANRFLIAVAASEAEAASLLADAGAHTDAWQAARRRRMQGLIAGNHALTTGDERTTRALRWIVQTTDQLLTRQRGDGIYAGLPWFNEYWGRDEFISLAGATLVTGRFDAARAILASFAQFQDLDPASQFYGRVPNIVKPGSLDYHTTDGTPRLVIGLRDYVRYSGDRSLVAQLYPNVKASIDGALKHWTDASGYLLHADNETWMDARREGDLRSYSPRATRANDIQALWYQQLRAGAEFAAMSADPDSAARWNAVADRLRGNFAKDFVEAGSGRIADHLDAQGRADFTLRPNLLFALDLVPAEVAAAELKRAWTTLVFPWGVATLDPADARFHPFHLAPGRWHKDAAYHNGTVWPWLDGIALQRMIERGQVERAWPLLRFNNAMALERGVVGGLAETMDAYPHAGEPWPRLTGTYLQAWSNAEQLRVVYQYVFGVRPDMGRGELTLAPRLPLALGEVNFATPVGAGVLHARIAQSDGGINGTYRLEGQAARLLLDLPDFATTAVDVAPGQSLAFAANGHSLHLELRAVEGKAIRRWQVNSAPAQVAESRRMAERFRDAGFATPEAAIVERVPDDGQ